MTTRDGEFTAGPLMMSAIFCVLLLAAIYGCVPEAGGQETVTAERIQCLERLGWQWVPPQSVTFAGQVQTIPAHWHKRFEPCSICGDRTRRPGTVQQANPQLTPIEPTTHPAASAPQAAAPQVSLPDGRFERIEAELSGLNARMIEEVRRGRESAEADRAAILAALGKLDQRDNELAESINWLAAERDGAGAVGDGPADQAGAEPVRNAAREALGAGGKWAIGRLVATYLPAGTPYGLALAGGALAWWGAGQLRRWWKAPRGVTDAGGREAPAPDGFPEFVALTAADRERQAHDRDRHAAAAAADGDGATVRPL